MKLTIEQALQQGIAAHKEGKLHDAERLYRAILHPSSNYLSVRLSIEQLLSLVIKTRYVS